MHIHNRFKTRKTAKVFFGDISKPPAAVFCNSLPIKPLGFNLLMYKQTVKKNRLNYCLNTHFCVKILPAAELFYMRKHLKEHPCRTA